ncbi:MAG: FG-GAP repeat domain-containing protein, partial [Usitatibacter sp.]
PDLDGDRRADLLWYNVSTGQVYAMLMDGGFIKAQGMVYAEPNTSWRIVAAGDFAGSGKSNQLLWRNSTTGQVYLMTVLFSAGVFSVTGAMIYQEPNAAWKILAAPDLDGDGRSDILWRNDATGQVYGMLMNGATIVNQGMIYSEPHLEWKIVAQGDYNGDGKADLLYRNEATGQVYMMLMNGLSTGAAAMVYVEPNTAWKVMGPYEYAQ